MFLRNSFLLITISAALLNSHQAYPAALSRTDDDYFAILLDAIKHNRPTAGHWALKNITDINVKNAATNNNGLLHMAAIQGNVEATRTFLGIEDINIEMLGQDEFTPLQRAAQYGHLDVVQALIEDGHALIDNQGGRWQRTALHLAAEAGHLHIVQYLVTKGANLDLQDRYGWTPLMLALVCCHINPGASLAAGSNRPSIAAYLIDQNADLLLADDHGRTVLYRARRANLSSIVSKLQAKRPDLEEQNHSYWSEDSYAGEPDIVLTPEQIADMESFGRRAPYPCLDFSCDWIDGVCNIDEKEKNDREYKATDTRALDKIVFSQGIQQLISFPDGVDFNACDESGNTYLIAAAVYGCLESVMHLLTIPGIDVEKQDKDGFTPLQRAAQYGHLDVVKALIENGHALIDNQGGSWQRTALHLAAETGHLDIIRYLVSKEANLNLQDLYGVTPLMLALVYCRTHSRLSAAKIANYIEIVRYGIDQRARLNLKDNNGSTLLHFAVTGNFLTIVTSILQRDKTLLTVADKYGKSPIDYSKDEVKRVCEEAQRACSSPL